jgi:SAM-dependent methyltransferase
MNSGSLVTYIKSYIPPSLVSVVNSLSSKVDPVFISFYRLRTRWSKPIPPFDLRRITAKRAIDNYIKSGERIVNSFKEGLNSIGKDINEFGEILDFGCGAGRQIQYFYDYKTSKITGCDPNADHIRWLSANYPLASFYVSNFDPPLPFPDEHFDLVYSVSVFTHLSEKAQFNWLAELKRVLRPEGMALLTTLGEHAAESADKNQSVRRDSNEPKSFCQALSQQKFLFYVPESYRQVNKSINPDSISDDDMYGITWHSQEYIVSNWNKYFEIVKIIPGCIDSLQDLVILRRL